MKQLLFCAFAAILFATSSCKKKDNDNKTINGWILNGTTHNVTSAYRTTSSFYDELKMISNTDTLNCIFPSFPTASGSYPVASVSSPVFGNKMAVIVNQGSSIYGSTGSDNVNAIVTVNNGKMSITIPDIWVVNAVTADTVKMSGTITEP